MTNSTLSGNSAAKAAAASTIRWQLTLSNSTLSGNLAVASAAASTNSKLFVSMISRTRSSPATSSRQRPVRQLNQARLQPDPADDGFTFTETVPGSNVFGVNPLLGPLAYNGGPTLTHRPLAGQPALDRGSNPDNLALDQRGFGFDRVIGAAADIGAVESRDPDVRLVPDPQDRSQKVLVIVGSAAATRSPLVRTTMPLEVEFNGEFHVFDKAGVGRVVAFGMEGNDQIEVGQALTFSAFLDGGRGADTLLGGAGNDILLGGAGNDVLRARRPRHPDRRCRQRHSHRRSQRRPPGGRRRPTTMATRPPWIRSWPSGPRPTPTRRGRTASATARCSAIECRSDRRHVRDKLVGDAAWSCSSAVRRTCSAARTAANRWPRELT